MLKKELNNFHHVGVDEDLVQRLVLEEFPEYSVLRKAGVEILVRQNVLEHQYKLVYGPKLLPNNLNKNSFDYMREIMVDLNEYDFYWEKSKLELEGLEHQVYQSLKIDILNGNFFYSKSKLSVIKPLLNLYYKKFDSECVKCFEINGNGCREFIDNISCHYLNVINSPDLKPLLIKTNFSWVPSILGLTVFNYMSGCIVYNLNIYDFCSMEEMHTALFNSLPILVEPVADTKGILVSLLIHSPTVLSPCINQFTPSGTWFALNTLATICCTAFPQIGVFSLGFQTVTFPQTHANAAFQLHTATGKLNAEIIPTIPIGCHCSYILCEGLSLCMVSPCNCLDNPTAKSQMSIISCTSPKPSCKLLPIS